MGATKPAGNRCYFGNTLVENCTAKKKLIKLAKQREFKAKLVKDVPGALWWPRGTYHLGNSNGDSEIRKADQQKDGCIK